MKRGEAGDLKVKYGKTGKLMYREISINTPYLRGEKLFRAVINPYTKEETHSRTLSPKARGSVQQAESGPDARNPQPPQNLAQSDTNLGSRSRLPRLLNSVPRQQPVSQSHAPSTYASPYAPAITKKRPAFEPVAPKPKAERPPHFPAMKVPTLTSLVQAPKSHYVVGAH